MSRSSARKRLAAVISAIAAVSVTSNKIASGLTPVDSIVCRITASTPVSETDFPDRLIVKLISGLLLWY